MTTSPLVSVALASYNGERFIAEQLESILGQSRRPDEVVVSDGGSDDSTVRIVREVFARASRDVRVRVVSDGARLGVAANFERAITATAGDFIALSDQDDRWHPDRLANGLVLLKQPGVLLAAGNAALITAEGTPMPLDLFTALGVGPDEVATLRAPGAFALLLRRNLVTGATVMFRRELLEAARPFPDEWVHDEWLAILAAAIGRLAVDSDPRIDYRQHGANEIGVRAPTVRYRIGRMLEPRGDRYRVLARRARVLAERLSALPVSQQNRALAQRKAAFEAVRAEYGGPRFTRIGPVARRLRDGSYREFSSQGTLDAARDLLQPE